MGLKTYRVPKGIPLSGDNCHPFSKTNKHSIVEAELVPAVIHVLGYANHQDGMVAPTADLKTFLKEHSKASQMVWLEASNDGEFAPEGRKLIVDFLRTLSPTVVYEKPEGSSGSLFYHVESEESIEWTTGHDAWFQVARKDVEEIVKEDA